APGGWVFRTDPDGEHWHLVCAGFRNSYDIAVAPDGAVFTFDSDMEWDMGMPWYRPTRILHVVEGGDYGWRSGSAKWPIWYPDSLPSVLDIGPGSPTGILFGAEARFPQRYRDALFALDWTFGTIWAVHLLKHGASYTASKEAFVTGSPLPLADATIADGALYFLTGGRGLGTRLFRVTALGSLTSGVKQAPPSKPARDRFVEHAQRVSLERRPLAEWKDEALAVDATEDPVRALQMWLALVRCADKSVRSALADRLLALDLAALRPDLRRDMLRVFGLVILRLGAPTGAERERWIAKLLPLVPTGDWMTDVELVSLLVRLEAPGVVSPALDLMTNTATTTPPKWMQVIARNDEYGNPIRRMLLDPPPTRGIRHAHVLRNMEAGWTLPRRRLYFNFLNEARKKPGGNTYEGFVANIRADALETCSPGEKLALRATLRGWVSAEQFKPSKPKGPGRRWTLAAAQHLLDKPLRRRNFKNGKNIYHAATCAKCHRFDGTGGAAGPDLTGIGKRFSAREMLEAIIEPSKAIADQYVAEEIEMRDGEKLLGYLIDAEVWPPNPDEEPTTIDPSQIKSRHLSRTSPMPPELIDAINQDELLDLIAYLVSGGNRKHRVFKKNKKQ
ncbi:MAG: c-type cytochrome, partial [Planctomycetota bacterium]|nr:c-type cytochrome [Planctomycetota bacterium]